MFEPAPRSVFPSSERIRTIRFEPMRRPTALVLPLAMLAALALAGTASAGDGLLSGALSPVTQAASPLTDVVEPVTEAAKPVTDAVAPATDATAPLTEAIAPVTKPVAPVTQAVE